MSFTPLLWPVEKGKWHNGTICISFVLSLFDEFYTIALAFLMGSSPEVKRLELFWLSCTSDCQNS
jgi:hypothetical protein